MVSDNSVVTYSARIPVNVDNKVKTVAKNIGVSKNAILLLALKEYFEKEAIMQ